jgi:hypothetical protein
VAGIELFDLLERILIYRKLRGERTIEFPLFAIANP